MSQTAIIATFAFFHERTTMICTLLGLAAILTPLLVLFGLKFGVVSGMRDRLERDPRIRVLQPIGQGSYDEQWFATLRALPGAAFVLPTTRFLAATISLQNPSHSERDPINAELVPTAPHDPLLSEARRRGAGRTAGLGRDEDCHFASRRRSAAHIAGDRSRWTHRADAR